MAEVPTIVNNFCINDLNHLPITPIAYSMVSKYLDKNATMSLQEKSFPFRGYVWETMCITIKRTNGEVVEVVFSRDSSVDSIYSLESLDIYQS